MLYFQVMYVAKVRIEKVVLDPGDVNKRCMPWTKLTKWQEAIAAPLRGLENKALKFGMKQLRIVKLVGIIFQLGTSEAIPMHGRLRKTTSHAHVSKIGNRRIKIVAVGKSECVEPCKGPRIHSDIRISTFDTP